MTKSKQQIGAELTKRGLVSVMNHTKWPELRNSVPPFVPPYQLKLILSLIPHPEQFEVDVNYEPECSLRT